MGVSQHNPARGRGSDLKVTLVAGLFLVAAAATFASPIHVKPGCRQVPDLAAIQPALGVKSGVYGAPPQPRCE